MPRARPSLPMVLPKSVMPLTSKVAARPSRPGKAVESAKTLMPLESVLRKVGDAEPWDALHDTDGAVRARVGRCVRGDDALADRAVDERDLLVDRQLSEQVAHGRRERGVASDRR